jgi:hypothetical protein
VTKRIGQYFREKGLLSERQVLDILDYSESQKLRFGESAIALGFLKQSDLARLFGNNNHFDFFNIDIQYFPHATKEVLPIGLILKMGALPLGTKTESGFFSKKRYLNLGFIDPSKKEILVEVENYVKTSTHQNFDGIKVFLLLADQFIEALEKVYGLSEPELASAAKQGLHPGLSLLLK